MHALAAAFAVLVAEGPAPLDASKYRDLQVVTDGKGHYVAFDSRETGTVNVVFSSGDGKTFLQARVWGGHRNGQQQWSARLWDPRAQSNGNGSEVAMNDTLADQDAGSRDGRVFTVTCADRSTEVKLMPASDAKKLLETATFLPPSWTRQPERLFRDDTGVYYLVDRLRTAEPTDRRDFRVFAGPRGNMKQLPLKDIVDDSKGMILATKNGNLRLVTGAEGKWIQGKEVTTLTEVEISSPGTARMIYLDLGPYNGQRLGTPCDDFM